MKWERALILRTHVEAYYDIILKCIFLDSAYFAKGHVNIILLVCMFAEIFIFMYLKETQILTQLLYRGAQTRWLTLTLVCSQVQLGHVTIPKFGAHG